jgi:regulator of ribonuclease activity A
MPAFTTPDLCDQFPDDVHVAEPLFSSFGAIASFGGEVVTVKCFEDNSKVKELVERNGSGKVIVVDGGGSLRHALLGDKLAAKAAANGWQGLIINGCVRDVDILRQTPLGIHALRAHPLKTDKRGLGDIGIPVRFAGVTFTPGHFVYADHNGIIVAARALV